MLSKATKDYKPIIVHINDIYIITRNYPHESFVLRHSFAMRADASLDVGETFTVDVSALLKSEANAASSSSSSSNPNSNTTTSTTSTTSSSSSSNGKHKEKREKKPSRNNANNNNSKKTNPDEEIELELGPCFAFANGEWKERVVDESTDGRVIQLFRVATFNVLFDLHLAGMQYDKSQIGFLFIFQTKFIPTSVFRQHFLTYPPLMPTLLDCKR